LSVSIPLLISGSIAILGIVVATYTARQRQMRLSTIDFIKRYYFDTNLKQRIRLAIRFLATSLDDPTLARLAEDEQFTRLFDDLGSINFLISISIKEKQIAEGMVKRVFIEYLAMTVLCAERLNSINMRRPGYSVESTWIYKRWGIIFDGSMHTPLALSLVEVLGLYASSTDSNPIAFNPPVPFR
jgi:hypothetical protein